jgi:glycogen synthase
MMRAHARAPPTAVTLRVLHCIYDDPSNPWVGGGGSVRAREIYRRLAGRVDATVATGRFPGARDARVDGVRYVRLGAARPYAWSRLTYARAAERLLRDAEYDAAVLDFSAYAPVRVPAGRPVGVTVHHLTGPTAGARWSRPVGGVVARVERLLLRRGGRFSADSRATAIQLAEIVGPGVPIDVIGAGVDDRLFALSRRPEGWVLYFGRLDVHQKGLDTLLHAVARLARARGDVELRVAGRGRDGDAVRRLARALGVERHVRVLGAVSDDARLALLAGAAVQAMPSRFEGFGLAAAEAMAAGVPLVATHVGSLPEVLDAPRGGVLVPPDDPAALADALGRLLDSADARAALGRSARRAAERHRWGAVAEAHLGWLERIAAGDP